MLEKTLKKCKVHAIPTEKATYLFKDKDGKWMYSRDMFTMTFEEIKRIGAVGYHLYFTSDEEIKEPCWIIAKTTEGDKLLSIDKIGDNPKYFEVLGGYGIFRDICRKIVATNNPKLWRKIGLGTPRQPIEVSKDGCDKISQDFNEAFVREQGIWEVNLECDILFPHHDKEGRNIHGITQYKLNSQGAVIVHKVKEKLLPISVFGEFIDFCDKHSRAKTMEYFNEWYDRNHNKK